MKKEKISDTISQIDADIIEEAAECKASNTVAYKRKRLSLVACLVFIIALGGTIGFWTLSENSPDTTKPTADNISLEEGFIHRSYKSGVVSEDNAMLWRWEFLSPEEKYLSIKVNGSEFSSRGQEIDASLLDKKLGSYTATGYDYYENNKVHSEVFEVYGIKDVSTAHRVAVKIANGYYVYSAEKQPVTSTLGDIIDGLGLDKTATISGFHTVNGTKNSDYRSIRNDSFLLQMLCECRTAPLANGESNIKSEKENSTGTTTPAYNPGAVPIEEFSLNGRNYISFSVSSKAIGAYKLALSVTEDGYIWTNIADYGYAFYIGTEKSKQITQWAYNNSTVAEPEPHYYTIIGRIAEISDGFVSVDDSDFCTDKSEGKVFKVLTNDIKIRRCFEYAPYGLTEGSIAIFSFTQPIRVTENNTVSGAVDVQKGIITSNGENMIPE